MHVSGVALHKGVRGCTSDETHSPPKVRLGQFSGNVLRQKLTFAGEASVVNGLIACWKEDPNLSAPGPT